MSAGFVEFEFDLPEALLAGLTSKLTSMAGAPLIPANLAGIPDAQGVYMLLHRGIVAYIGKTDAEAGLRKRLERHARTVQHRRNLLAEDVTFKAVRIFVFTAMDLETQLIRYYSPVPWNNSGFGSNDPGRQRDTTGLKPDGFDACYPIDIDREIAVDFPSTAKALFIVDALKAALPYTFRVERQERGKRPPHPELESAEISLPCKPHSARSLIEALVRGLPEGWQATALSSRIIMYRETREYPYGEVIARS
jgi:Uri superfamily endonuclease